MKTHNYTILFILTLFVLSSCNNQKLSKDYYIISKNDSFTNAPYKVKDYTGENPPPPPPPELKWYTDVVFIFDSTDRVHIYQTKIIENSDYDKLIKQGSLLEPDFPYFLGLQPKQLLTIKSNNFADFIKDNNDIFKLDTLQYNYRRIFLAASTTDTIKNSAFYDLLDLIKTKSPKQQKVLFLTRLTTEEENYVIKCKRMKIEFKPEQQIWKGKYLDGKCEPYTKEFELVEKRCGYVRKAINNFDPECTRLPRKL